ncbi:MAG: DUF4402 domain-containing protein [Rickettsiales bacterium]|nr:DUF4402 domain-containing protein [Pseudomonadota bacterium]MDA0967091.1 DUF4402 domain-containing protein [Pseudomonadota bacterium]MDG4542423.1 DUF4402 domain-containing protein [Rickettsiales bacterium]MDG4544927.1 DUF4402 domain-containing protein [Rickettsiales bacterium]MDG4547050.1 DUF4402 domain-containing protein [Rickettsiales bacterium]
MGKLRLFLLAIIGVLSSNPAFSETASSTASVQIHLPMQVNQLQELNFGKVFVPNSGSHLVVVRRNGQYNANTQGTIGSFQQNARFRIFGTPNAVVNYTVISTNSTIPGVDFDSLLIPASQTIGANGRRAVNVGGRIFVHSNAVPGVYTSGELSYTFMAEYE